jgi:hypothetical protein
VRGSLVGPWPASRPKPLTTAWATAPPRKRSGITNDPKHLDDPQDIVRLIGQVITVSLETVAVVKGLPELE